MPNRASLLNDATRLLRMWPPRRLERRRANRGFTAERRDLAVEDVAAEALEAPRAEPELHC